MVVEELIRRLHMFQGDAMVEGVDGISIREFQHDKTQFPNGIVYWLGIDADEG